MKALTFMRRRRQSGAGPSADRGIGPRMPIMEVGIGGALGAVFWTADASALAEMTWLFAALAGLNRVAVARQLNDSLRPVRRLAAMVDLDGSAGIEELRKLQSAYFKIADPVLDTPRDSIVNDALGQLERLAATGTSPVLPTGAYYSWLLPRIAAAEPGSEIWAVSMMMDCEWDDSPPEQRFLAENLDAAARGVSIQRVFIAPRAHVEQLTLNPAIAAQSAARRIDTLVVYREQLERTDRQLLRSLGDGMIAFDRRFALIDEHSQEGEARGYVTTNRNDIDRWRHRFESLLPHAMPLQPNAGLSKRARNRERSRGTGPTPATTSTRR